MVFIESRHGVVKFVGRRAELIAYRNVVFARWPQRLTFHATNASYIRDEWGTNYVCNPKLVAEILSASTEHIDRREKVMTYRRVVSIEEYVLLEQDQHKVIVHRRAEDWKPHIYMGPQAVAEFRCIGFSVPLAEIYAGTLR